MTWLVLVLWASLLSVELARGMDVSKVSDRNLTCFQCFNVQRETQCHPIECQPNEKVCVSRKVLLYTSVNGRTQISKRCATTCPSSSDFNQLSFSSIQDRIIRKCCSTDRCNRAPGSWEGFWSILGRLLLPMGLSLFCTLL
ncbi:lymphocyte antigen 6L-like [Mus caroli]|uniref:Lymphocyte antigen 6L-like n=1 Tax=Mus caroli TaxID=10089 RepID=A0A6P5PDE4_MUSCR|nr:lymphocyte antigen 6L-like [Mus caroli]